MFFFLVKVAMIITKTSQPLKIVFGHCRLPKQAATRSNNKRHLLELTNFDTHSGISYFMHPHTWWKILSWARSYLDMDSHIYVTQATNIPSERSTNETPRNILHRMDRSHDTMQLNMIVTLERMKLTPTRK